jgi:tetratricopeptide (TPR) repeat protein
LFNWAAAIGRLQAPLGGDDNRSPIFDTGVDLGLGDYLERTIVALIIVNREGEVMIARSFARRALLVLMVSASLAPSLASAQMMGGGAAVMGNGVGGREFDGDRRMEFSYDPVVEYNKGVAALQAHKYGEASRAFDHALKSDPRNADYLHKQGLARAGAGDLRGAVKSYEKSLAIDSIQVDTRRDYALALAQMGQADKAQAQFAQLKLQSEACAGTCPNAAALQSALSDVQAAVAAPGSKPG